MTQSFSLLTQPWIPCTGKDGSMQELGLRDVLSRSHDLRSVESSQPLEIAAILRLLLALLHRIFGTENISDWEKLWRAGSWDTTALDTYFSQWQERFDLFHPIYPFYQQRDERVEARSIANLFPGLSSVEFYNHELSTGNLMLTPAEAARWLLVAQTFGLPGICHPQKKLFFNGGVWLIGMIFFVEGHSLFETLAFNLLPYAPGHPRPNLDKSATDRPNWETDDPYTPLREIPLGYLDYLTFPNRRVLLIPEQTPNGCRVRQIFQAPGLKLRGELYDPFKHYRLSDDGWKILGLNPAKALWRNSSVLLEIHAEGKKVPAVLNWLAMMAEEGLVAAHARYRLMAFGMASDQAKVDLVRMEHLPLPVDFLRNTALISELDGLLGQADKIRNKLMDALHQLAVFLLAMQADLPKGRKPDKDDVTKLVNHWSAERVFWQMLDQPFLRLMEALPLSQPENIREQWKKALQRAAWESLDSAISLVGESPQALKAGVNAPELLAGGWNKVFSIEKL